MFGYGHNWCMGWMGWMGIMPLLWIVLIATVIYFLIKRGREVGNSRAMSSKINDEHGHCSKCGEQTQSGWKVCPHCGTSLDSRSN